jgi:hypothetical protein
MTYPVKHGMDDHTGFESPPAKIVTDFWMKPIPIRQFDWSAYRDGDEPDDDGNMMIGYGATEQDAIDDLRDQMEDAR